MNIIKAADPVGFSLFSSEPVSSNELTFVYKNSNNEYKIISDGQQLQKSDFLTKKYSFRYSVSRVPFGYKHDHNYASKVPGKNFRVIVNITVKVVDPEKIVKMGLDNLKKHLDDNMHYWIQPITEEYSIEEFQQIKQKMQLIKSESTIVAELAEYGLQVTELKALVRLSPEDWLHYQKMEEMKRQHQVEQLKRQQQLEFEEQERARKKQEEEEKKRAEEERKRKAAEALLNGGDLQFAIEVSENNDQLLNFVFDKLKSDRSLQQLAMETIIKNGDVDDVIRATKHMGEINQRPYTNGPQQQALPKATEGNGAFKKMNDLLLEEGINLEKDREA